MLLSDWWSGHSAPGSLAEPCANLGANRAGRFGQVDARIRLCGRLEVELDGERVEDRLPGRQGPLVFALLVLNRRRPVARDELIGALWPAAPPADPDEALSALLSKVRQALGKDRLTGRRELTLVLAADAEVDVEQARSALTRAEEALAGSDPGAAFDAASVAAEISGSSFLVGHDAPWVEDRRREMEELRLDALEAVAAAGIAIGGTRAGEAERAARELTRLAPLREVGHRLLMEALAARGEPAAALAAYEDLRVLLRDELGVHPSEQIRALHARLLAGDTGRPGEIPLPVALEPRSSAAFVGRERELDRLRRAWRDTASGRRRVVLVSGGPGIGKTRLSSELAREAHAGGTVLYAACEDQMLVSYQPFVEALRHYVRSTPGETAGGLGPGASELASLIPELARDQPGPADGSAPDDLETRRYLMFEAVSSLLTTAASRAPLLLVLDDLHWADRSTLLLLRHVVRAQHEAAMLILGTYRDTDVGAGHPLLDLVADLRRDGSLERVSLAGLGSPEVEALIESHAGESVSSALVETVHAETAGNPFFVEEVVRHLMETGGVDVVPEHIGVPEGVKEVVALRVNRLSETCRDVLTNAAVLGREFPFSVLAPMTGIGRDGVIDALEEAVGARLVEEEPSHGEPMYAFVHALVRETLYGALSGPRRQRMHAAAAAAIEATGMFDADARIAALALHYRLAGTAADPVTAIQYSLQAGERARQLFAWDEALTHWDGAVGLMERTDGSAAERARMLVALAQICTAVGELGREIGYLERALRLYRRLGDEERTAQLHSRLGMAHALIDSIYAEHLDVARAFEHFDAAREVLNQGPVRRARGHLEVGVSTAHSYGLQTQPGIEAGSRAMEIAEELGDDVLWAGAATVYGWHKIVAGHLREGFDAVERAFEAADREQRPFVAWMAVQTSGQMTWGLGNPDRAQRYFERALGLSSVKETSYRQTLADGIGRCHASRGEIDRARALLSDAKPTWITHSLQPLLDLWDGNWDRVETLASRVLETSRRTGNRWDEWAAQHLAGRVAYLRGEPGRAAELLEEARAIVVDGGARYFEMWVLPDLARALAEVGQVEAARAHVDRCREIMTGADDWHGRGAIVELAAAVILSFEARVDAAEERFASALATLREHRLVADQADCLHQWGLALARSGDASLARDKLGEAAHIYRRHGAGRVWLERVG
jgi:DNA-binding SARP family transcriptional activator/tetratricopeptide (TPR) repeat protein